MKILPLHPAVGLYAKKHRLEKKLIKQIQFLQINPHHPSLEFELLEPGWLRVYSFRVDKKYRAICIFRDPETIEIIEVNNHYA